MLFESFWGVQILGEGGQIPLPGPLLDNDTFSINQDGIFKTVLITYIFIS